MTVFSNDDTVARGVALHKLIRMITLSLGGEGYLNFMGNEFGHPEWIDFPREGNGWSYFYCRRQWHLADDHLLKYGWLNRFDKALVQTTKSRALFEKAPQCLFIDANAQVLNYERNGLVFALNFSPASSYEGYYMTVPKKGKYQVVLSTDDKEFGGYDRISKDYVYTSEEQPDGSHKVRVYLPARSGLCMVKVK
jgi:1,4-alpha-glucan branching enzyme